MKPTDLFVDDFKTHASKASINAFAELGAELVPHRTDTTVLQTASLRRGHVAFKKDLRPLSMTAELKLPKASGPRVRYFGRHC